MFGTPLLYILTCLTPWHQASTFYQFAATSARGASNVSNSIFYPRSELQCSYRTLGSSHHLLKRGNCGPNLLRNWWRKTKFTIALADTQSHCGSMGRCNNVHITLCNWRAHQISALAPSLLHYASHHSYHLTKLKLQQEFWKKIHPECWGLLLFRYTSCFPLHLCQSVGQWVGRSFKLA